MLRITFLSSLLLTCVTLSGCRSGDQTLLGSDGDSSDNSSDDESAEREANWDDATHSKKVDPDYVTVFPETELLRFEITIDSAQWTAMQADLGENLGTTTGAGGPGGMTRPGEVPTVPVEVTDSDYTPLWGEATIAFDGGTWEHVGIRYKGNSTLRTAYQSGTDKFPFKLDFDEWEDSYPEIDDQRFYGFKQLNLGSNANDASFMRERVASDLFRSFGVPSAQVSFCEVYLDRGNGMDFVGLYSLVEEVDDTLIETQFPDPSGNLYKPENEGATFAEGSYNEVNMYLKTNEDQPDYSDVFAFYEALHDDARTNDSDAWATQLESTFYVDGFLRYLAVNQVIQNWDTYGVMTHNYFLYSDEGLLTWVPWDNNESLKSGNMGGALSLSLNEVSDEWPILRFVMDVPAFEDTYRSYVQEFASGYFTEEKCQPSLRSTKQ